MANKKEVEENTVEIPQRIHIAEFLMGQDLSDLQKSAFIMIATKEWMTEEEWQSVLESYVGKKE